MSIDLTFLKQQDHYQIDNENEVIVDTLKNFLKKKFLNHIEYKSEGKISIYYKLRSPDEITALENNNRVKLYFNPEDVPNPAQDKYFLAKYTATFLEVAFLEGIIYTRNSMISSILQTRRDDISFILCKKCIVCLNAEKFFHIFNLEKPLIETYIVT
jgi:hypothetical protein